MTPIRPKLKLPALALLLCLGMHWSVAAQEPEEPGADPVVASKEYFVEQKAGEALLVRISALEARFESQLSADNTVLATSGLPGMVTLPVYHFISSYDADRQVNINVSATQVTNRTEFDLQLTRLNVRDDRTAGVASAYRLLSSGLEVLPEGNIPQATVRIQTLFRAADVFQEIGMEEMRLWSRLFGAHLVLRQMNDHQTALDWAGDLLNEPRISRYPEIEFAAKKLRSTAMAEGRIGVGGTDPARSPLQLALAETVSMAKTLDYRLEEAMALLNAGVDLVDNGMHRQARNLLESALSIAEDIEAADLAATIREQMVEAYAQGGEEQATGAILQDIETHLVEEGDEQELALNLIRQGRIHADGYRFSEAAEVLARAVELEQGTLSLLEAQLDLGLVLSAAGREDEALNYLYQAVVNPENGEFRRRSGLLKIATALDEIAAIHRHRQEWPQLDEIRDAQEDTLNSPTRHAWFAYQEANDALRRHGPGSQTTVSRYGRAFRLADGAGQAELRHLTRLGLCALDAMDASDPLCHPGELRISFNALKSAAFPHWTAEATLLYARWLDRAGRETEAYAVSDELNASLVASGHVRLGSWYWFWREDLAGDYLALAMKTESGRANAATSMLALINARVLARSGEQPGVTFSEDDLQALLRALPRDGVILGYFLNGSDAHAWTGKRNGVRRVSLGNGERIGNMGHSLRRALEAGDTETIRSLSRELGRMLLDPVSRELEAQVYLLNHGPLLGVPIDLLFVNDEPLASRYSLAQLALSSPGSASVLPPEFQAPSGVFLAGDPQDWSAEFASRLEASGEMRAVNDLFIGPGLHAVQGVALLADEFQDERYRQAGLVHLATPGIIDLSPSGKSGLFLSEPVRGEGREVLDSDALASMPLAAELAFLSRTEFSGAGDVLENHTGVVSAMLDAGAGAVVASLWSVEPGFRARFVTDFYERLRNEENILSALSLAKRNALANGEPVDWASFQLFLN